MYFSVPAYLLDAGSGDFVPRRVTFFEWEISAFPGPVLSACSGELQVGDARRPFVRRDVRRLRVSGIVRPGGCGDRGAAMLGGGVGRVLGHSARRVCGGLLLGVWFRVFPSALPLGASVTVFAGSRVCRCSTGAGLRSARVPVIP